MILSLLFLALYLWYNKPATNFSLQVLSYWLKFICSSSWAGLTKFAPEELTNTLLDSPLAGENSRLVFFSFDFRQRSKRNARLNIRTPVPPLLVRLCSLFYLKWCEPSDWDTFVWVSWYMKRWRGPTGHLERAREEYFSWFNPFNFNLGHHK